MNARKFLSWLPNQKANPRNREAWVELADYMAGAVNDSAKLSALQQVVVTDAMETLLDVGKCSARNEKEFEIVFNQRVLAIVTYINSCH